MKTAIAAAIGKVFETMSFCELTDCGDEPLEMPIIGASLRFQGTLNGEFRLAISERSAARMAADFLAADAEGVTPSQVESVVSELANVTCGAALRACSPAADIHFTVPCLLNAAPPNPAIDYRFSTTGERPDVEVGISFSEAT